MKDWMVQVDFQRKASKPAVPLGKSYLRLKQQRNHQCNELLDCDILNFHTSLLLSVDVELPKIEKGRGLELCLKVLTVQTSSEWTLHQHWLRCHCWQTQNAWDIFIIWQQLAKDCKLHCSLGFFRGFGFGDFLGVF